MSRVQGLRLPSVHLVMAERGKRTRSRHMVHPEARFASVEQKTSYGMNNKHAGAKGVDRAEGAGDIWSAPTSRMAWTSAPPVAGNWDSLTPSLHQGHSHGAQGTGHSAQHGVQGTGLTAEGTDIQAQGTDRGTEIQAQGIGQGAQGRDTGCRAQGTQAQCHYVQEDKREENQGHSEACLVLHGLALCRKQPGAQ